MPILTLILGSDFVEAIWLERRQVHLLRKHDQHEEHLIELDPE